MKNTLLGTAFENRRRGRESTLIAKSFRRLTSADTRLGKSLLRILITGPAFLGLVTSAYIAPAQDSLTLVEYTNVWRYFTNGTDLGSAWRAKAYNDAAWPSGRGLLGWEPSNPQFYRAPFSTTFVPFTRSIITYYFRTHFNFTNNVCGVMLVSSNYIDDGAVLYLNGTEMARSRVPTNQNYLTFANGSPATEGQDDVATFTPPPGVLVQGDNVVAVEVHQISAISGDIVWGMNLTAVLRVPITLMEPPPTHVVVEVGQMATLSVAAAGSDLHYHWYKNGAQVSGATSAVLKFVWAQPSDAGRYFVVITNCLSVVTGSVINLIVVPDSSAPALISATVQDTVQADVIEVSFSEAMAHDTAIALSNYRLEVVDGCAAAVLIPVLAVQHSLGAPSTVLLRVGGPNWIPGQDYVLTVNNVTDLHGNVMAPPSNQVVLAFYGDLLPFDQGWTYFDDPFNPASPGTGWREQEFDDSQWSVGMGLFFIEETPLNNLCGAAQNWFLNYGPMAYYFRTRFVAPTNTGRAELKLRHVIDDGAVFYLNGLPIARFNMPAGPVTYETRAVARIENASCVDNPVIVVTNLVSGTNVLAVEVHQEARDAADGQFDVVFGLDLRGAVQRPVPFRSPLTISRLPPDKVRLAWDDTCLALEAASRVTGPWTRVAVQSPQTYTTTGGARFFRTRPR